MGLEPLLATNECSNENIGTSDRMWKKPFKCFFDRKNPAAVHWMDFVLWFLMIVLCMTARTTCWLLLDFVSTRYSTGTCSPRWVQNLSQQILRKRQKQGPETALELFLLWWSPGLCFWVSILNWSDAGICFQDSQAEHRIVYIHLWDVRQWVFDQMGISMEDRINDHLGDKLSTRHWFKILGLSTSWKFWPTVTPHSPNISGT